MKNFVFISPPIPPFCILHCVIVYPPAFQIATLDLLNFIKNESWVPCKMQNGGMGAAGFISSLGRDFADWVVIESLALPCLMASLLRRGSSAAQGDGEHGEPLRFFRRARCPHRAVPGDPESGIIIVSIIFCQEQDTIQLEKRHGN